MAELAPKYPDTVWFHLTGDLNMSLPNWGLGSAKIHQTIFLAGMVAGRETKTGKVGACMQVRIPETYSHLAAFALGVAYVNSSVEVVASWSDSWHAPERDVFMVQRMVANGMDIIFHRCGSLESINEATALGALSIGFNAEFKMLAGETLLLSPYFNWGIVVLEVARLVVEGKYRSSLPVDLFPGLESDAVGLSDPSYLVHKATIAQVLAVETALRNHTNDTFCGPTRTNTKAIVGKAGSCLTLADLRIFDWEPWNVVDIGHYALPSEACHPGEQSQWHEATETFSCSACPAGTYSQLIANMTYQAYICVPCPADTFSSSNSSECSACPSGTSVRAGQGACVPLPMATAVLVGIIAGAVVGLVILAGVTFGAWRAWKASADLRKLRKQFSNNNVAQECADAIACFNLESVAWLRTCKNPNKIQQSFLQILEMLTVVRPYIPDHVLSLFMHKDEEEDEEEPESGENTPLAMTNRGGPFPETGCESPISNPGTVVTPLRSPAARGRFQPGSTRDRPQPDSARGELHVESARDHQPDSARDSLQPDSARGHLQPISGRGRRPSPTAKDRRPSGTTKVRRQSEAVTSTRPPRYIQVGIKDRTSDESMMSSSQRGGRGKHPRGRHLVAESRAGEWTSKRCVYMVACISFAASSMGEEEVPHVGHVLGDIISIGKNFSATIDHVTYDRVALHWGLVTAVSEGALKATLAALDIAKVRERLPAPWNSLLRLSISIVQGFYNVATISAANHSFFVVGGALLHLTRDLVAKDLAAKCKCEILISAGVQQQVQYAIECMPRCFVGEILFWQPLKAVESTTGEETDEWMYELRNMEAGRSKWSGQSLCSAFHLAAQAHDVGALQLVVDSLREQFRAQMSPQDEACLELLLAGGGAGAKQR
eukprot:GGOE01012233.1.p1 GENE.GGOE01012233.1~~GGOE01012233.1.p1  ORF type:complete len:889 (-),score=186.13 GGOE01012233.1:1552-4218(-)